MTRATTDQADALHGIVGAALLEDLARYRAAGEGIPPALLAQVIKFLRDNGVDRPAQASRLRDELSELLPDFGPTN